MNGVGVATAAAEVFRPAIGAFRFRENRGGSYFVTYVFARNARIDVTEKKFLLADELMARVNIAVGSNGDIFASGAAAGYSLSDRPRD